MKTVNFKNEFPELQSEILEIAVQLQNLILDIFPKPGIESERENVGYGFGSGYKNLVFVITPQHQHVNLDSV